MSLSRSLSSSCFRTSIPFKKLEKVGDGEDEIEPLDLDQADEEEQISDEFVPEPIEYDNIEDGPIDDFGAIFDSQDEEEGPPTVVPEDILPKVTNIFQFKFNSLFSQLLAMTIFSSEKQLRSSLSTSTVVLGESMSDASRGR